MDHRVDALLTLDYRPAALAAQMHHRRAQTGERRDCVTMPRWMMLLALSVAITTPALAGPVEDAKAMADEGRALLDQAQKLKAENRTDGLTQGLKRYARAYLLITGRKLQNDAPDLLQEISNRIAQASAMPEVVKLREDLLARAVQAAVDGKLTDAYDHLASLRDLDPRDLAVEYAMTVVGQRMNQ